MKFEKMKFLEEDILKKLKNLNEVIKNNGKSFELEKHSKKLNEKNKITSSMNESINSEETEIKNLIENNSNYFEKKNYFLNEFNAKNITNNFSYSPIKFNGSKINDKTYNKITNNSYNKVNENFLNDYIIKKETGKFEQNNYLQQNHLFFDGDNSKVLNKKNYKVENFNEKFLQSKEEKFDEIDCSNKILNSEVNNLISNKFEGDINNNKEKIKYICKNDEIFSEKENEGEKEKLKFEKKENLKIINKEEINEKLINKENLTIEEKDDNKIKEVVFKEDFLEKSEIIQEKKNKNIEELNEDNKEKIISDLIKESFDF